MKRPPGRGRNIWTDAQVETNGLGGAHFGPMPMGTSAVPSVAPDSLYLLSLIIWVPLLFPLPPHDGFIPVTSTEAPVMYPLSSDAKNATTSATSTGMVGRRQNPTHSHGPKVITSHRNPSPPKHKLQPPILVISSQIPQILGSLHSGPFPRASSSFSAHPQDPPYVPPGLFQSPVRKYS